MSIRGIEAETVELVTMISSYKEYKDCTCIFSWNNTVSGTSASSLLLREYPLLLHDEFYILRANTACLKSVFR